MNAAMQRWQVWLCGLVLLGVALYLLDAILLPFAAGFAIAYCLDPPVGYLERLRIPRGIATLIALLGFLLAIGLALLVLEPLLQNQVGELIRRFPRFVEVARRDMTAVMGVLEERLSAEDFARLRDAVSARLGDAFAWLGQLLQGMLTSSLALFNLLSLVFITPVVAFFLLRDWRHIVARIDGWLPRPFAPTIRAQAAIVDATLAGYMRGQAMVCVLMATFYAVALSFAGLEFGLVLGLLVGLLIFIPVLGGAIGAGIAILLAITQFDSWSAVAIIAAIFLIGQAIEGNLLTPKLVGDRVNLHPVWIIFALLAFGNLFGLAGLLFAVPVAAVIGVLTRFALQRYLASPLYDPACAVDGKGKTGSVGAGSAMPDDDEPIRF